MFQDVPVWHKAQSPEHDDDGDLLFDVRQNADDPLPNRTLFGSL